MTNNKQSSLEYFWKQLEEKGNAHIETEGEITVNITIDVNEYRLLQKQAKAMHKQEVMRAYNASYNGFGLFSDGYALAEIYYDQYYNETFGGEDEQQYTK